MIDSYSFGSITINGLTFSRDLVLAWPAIAFWRRAASHEVSVNDVEPILVLEPRLIIFGTGESGVMKILPETEVYLKNKGIKIKALKTGEAVQEYNLRSVASPGVVAALHLTC